ncbi:MAG: T9SS type A sorting domain-containing protein [bacterium]|nr:T9SS type A sorting domain-containing protein [bacterium]
MKSKLICSGMALAVAFMLSAGASAESLKLKDVSGNETKVDLATLSHIDFNANQMVVHATSGEHTFSLADIDHMKFDMEMTGIETTEATLDDLNVAVENGLISVTSASGSAIAVAVYSIGGYTVAMEQGEGFVSVDLSQLPKGIYIVKANDKTIKFIR